MEVTLGVIGNDLITNYFWIEKPGNVINTGKRFRVDWKAFGNT